MNSRCPHHPNSKLKAKDCYIYKQFAEQYTSTRPAADKDDKDDKKKDDAEDGANKFQDPTTELNHIFGGPLVYESKRKQKLTDREINATMPEAPQYLRWSKVPIKFGRSDHPDRVAHPGRYPWY